MFEYSFKVDEDNTGKRLDVFLAENCKDVSRSQIKNHIKADKVFVNEILQKPNYIVQYDDVIIFKYEKIVAQDIKPEEIPLNILYEDNDILVINKQPGLVVHPGAGNPDHTLVNAVKFHTQNNLSTCGGDFRAGIVHRLDKDTSGIIIIAKNDWTHERLALQFENRAVVKVYSVIVRGVVQHDEGMCDAPIGKGKVMRKKMMVLFDEEAKHALSEFKVIERFNNATLLDVRIFTGRTHQIRVHMAHLGHPVLGDTLYGKDPFFLKIKRQCIHAAYLELTHPRTNEKVVFKAPLPDDMVSVLDKLRINQ